MVDHYNSKSRNKAWHANSIYRLIEQGRHSINGLWNWPECISHPFHDSSHAFSIMYLFTFAIFTFFLSVFAQTIEILSPSPNQLIHEDSFTVQVAVPDSISPAMSISVAIGLQHCGSKPCPVIDNDEILGEVLFAGDFKPQRINPIMPPFQNFTFNTSAVGIPSSHATIHVAQFLLIGAGPSAALSLQNVSVRFSKHI